MIWVGPVPFGHIYALTEDSDNASDSVTLTPVRSNFSTRWSAMNPLAPVAHALLPPPKRAIALVVECPDNKGQPPEFGTVQSLRPDLTGAGIGTGGSAGPSPSCTFLRTGCCPPQGACYNSDWPPRLGNRP